MAGRVLWLVCALQGSPRAYGPQANLSGTKPINKCRKEKDIWIRVLWSFHNLEPSKLEGCRLALRRCVEARCQDVECLSTLSVLCLVVALSDCIIIVLCYSDGELLLTRIHMSFSFQPLISIIIPFIIKILIGQSPQA